LFYCYEIGEIVEHGSTSYGVNKAGFVLHSAIHRGRSDINAIIHLHTGLAASLSILKCGLLPISQESAICGQVSYHDYEGILIDERVKEKLVNDLGKKNKILVLRNHGLVVCGSTLEEAWFYLFNFMFAADIQFHALSAAKSLENMNTISKEAIEQVERVVSGTAGGGVNEKASDHVEWKLGEMEFEAEMRRLELLVFKDSRFFFRLFAEFLNQVYLLFKKGYETGYPFKKPLKL
jgi:adducin